MVYYLGTTTVPHCQKEASHSVCQMNRKGTYFISTWHSLVLKRRKFICYSLISGIYHQKYLSVFRNFNASTRKKELSISWCKKITEKSQPTNDSKVLEKYWRKHPWKQPWKILWRINESFNWFTKNARKIFMIRRNNHHWNQKINPTGMLWHTRYAEKL